MSQSPTIECKSNGPYLVRDLADLRDGRGAPLPCKPAMALCRCGGSKTKPFCDGTHRTNGFSDARLSDGSGDRRESYRGAKITIHDNRAICAHAGRCTDGLAAVFRYGSEPWIEPDGAGVEAIVAAIANCPSGALSFSLAEGAAAQPSSQPSAIRVIEDGPYAVTGAVDLPGAPWGEGAARGQYTLCRCGGSKNKPFCDGSHFGIGFKDGSV